MCVCLFVLYRNPDGWTDWDKIRHRGGSQGVEGSWGFQPGTPHPRYRACKGGMGCLWRLNHAFWQKLYKTKVARGPQFSGCGSPFWTPNLDPEGPGPHVLLEP